MKLRIISILFMTLLIAQMPMTVFAAAVSLDMDKNEIRASQELEVSGTATELEEVLIKIVAPDEAVYYMDVLTVEDGEFQSTIGFPTTANGDTAGDYTVIVGYDEIQDTATVALTCEEDCDNGGGGNNGDNSDNDGNSNNGDNSDNAGNGNNGGNSDNNGKGNNGDNSNNSSNGNNGNKSSDNSQNKSKEAESNLPDTSTSIYNFLIVGLILLVLGSGVVYYQKKKKA
ncbi:LPXTG cell wall anchor domain-containing protein [Gracilibacillus sp. D59]|uniref:LPXTG cell wall anchor domain-containing protein n=1 Tax=Gracilibacillus sp. D59 TaxID=3457434 RepID=UPI003FCEA6FC